MKTKTIEIEIEYQVHEPTRHAGGTEPGGIEIHGVKMADEYDPSFINEDRVIEQIEKYERERHY